jgi:hypothetical protein
MGRSDTVIKQPTRIYIGQHVVQAQVSPFATDRNLQVSDACLLHGTGFPAVVTRFYLQTIPAFTHVRTSVYIYEKKDYEAAFSWVLKVRSESIVPHC